MEYEATSQNSDTCLNTESSIDSSANLKWFKTNIDGLSLYLFFHCLLLDVHLMKDKDMQHFWSRQFPTTNRVESDFHYLLIERYLFRFHFSGNSLVFNHYYIIMSLAKESYYVCRN